MGRDEPTLVGLPSDVGRNTGRGDIRLSFGAIGRRPRSVDLTLPVAGITWTVGGLIALLFVGHVFRLVLIFGLGYGAEFGFVGLLDLDAEIGLGTYVAALLLLLAGLLSLMIGRATRRGDRGSWLYWIGLGALLLFLSFDEACMIHERSIPLVKRFHNFRGVFFHAWLVPYLILLGLLALVAVRFLRQLPRWISFRLVAAGLVFLGGAVVMEMISGVIRSSSAHATSPLFDAGAAGIEEVLEMTGVLLLIRVLLQVIADRRIIVAVGCERH